MRLILCGLACGLAALILTPAAASAAEFNATLATSLSSGRYGNPDTTGTMVTSYGIQAELDGWRLQMTLPRMQVSGGSKALVVDGDILLVPNGRRRVGYGDMNLKIGHALPVNFIDLSLAAQFKLPTGSRGLTTGATDVTVSVDASKTIGRVTPFVSVGYQHIGNLPGFRLADGWTASAGTMVMAGRNFFMVSYEATHAIVPGAAARSLLAVAARPIGGGWNVSVYGSKGLSSGAASVMTGLALTRSFR